MAGAPSLGQNLSYNPFANTRQAPAAMPRNDGFSEDGLSYSVANDFNKIAAQALADYEARINYERQKGLSIDSRGIVNAVPVSADIQNRIYNETIAPVEQLYGGVNGNHSQPQLRTYKDDATGNIIGIDPISGKGKIVFEGSPKPAAVRAPDKYPLPTELNNMLQPSAVKMLTMPQISALLPALPDTLRTNAPASTYQGWLNSSNAAPTLSVTGGVTNSAPQSPIKILSVRVKK